MHCISPNFLITEKGLKSLQGNVNGVVFQEVHFCSKEKKSSPLKRSLSGSLE